MLYFVLPIQVINFLSFEYHVFFLHYYLQFTCSSRLFFLWIRFKFLNILFCKERCWNEYVHRKISMIIQKILLYLFIAWYITHFHSFKMYWQIKADTKSCVQSKLKFKSHQRLSTHSFVFIIILGNTKLFHLIRFYMLNKLMCASTLS